MKSNLKFFYYVILFSFIFASCSFLAETDIDETVVTIDLPNSPTSHSISDEEKASSKFNIYVNGNLAAENISTSFVMEAKVGETITIRMEALVDGSRIASGEKSITVSAGNNVVYIVLSEDREDPEPEPPEPEQTAIEINTVDQLKEYAEKMRNREDVTYPDGTTVPANTANYKLMNDLDLAGNGVVMSSSSAPFSGDFNGNGHKIMNLTSTSDPLFHDVDASGIIRNLTLESANISCYYGQQAPFALTMKGKLIGCQVSGSISGGTEDYGLAAGDGSGENAVIVGCLSLVDRNTVDGLCHSNDDTYGAAFATDSNVDDLNSQIREWNGSEDVQNDSRLKCEWHFVSGLSLVRGAP